MTCSIRKQLVAAFLAPALGLFALPAEAASNGMPARSAGAAAVRSFVALNYRASELLGMEVTSQGEDVGELKDIVVDLGTGEARYAILSYGGILGIGDRLYAVPLALVQPARGEPEKLVVNLDEAQLRRQPAFVPDLWPGWSGTGYWDDVERQGDARNTAKARGFRHGIRLSELLERDVETTRGEEVGEVSDAIVDLARQRVHFVVVEVEGLMSGTGPSLLQGERLVPLPLQAFYPLGAAPEAADRDVLVSRVQASRLRTLPGFDDDEWPDFNDATYLANLDRETGRLFRGDSVSAQR